jgi:DNA ligase (NAD+)
MCGAEVLRPEGEVMYYCTNAACPAQLQARLELFTSRGAMDIRGVGESMSALLLREGLVRHVADLYNLKVEELLKLERMGEKSATNIINAIEKSKKRPIARLVYALGIRHVGSETATLLAEQFNDLDDLAGADEARLMTVPGIGPKIAQSIAAFFRQEDNRRILEKLKDKGVWPTQQVGPTSPMPLAGREFVISGALKSFSREVAKEKIKTLGGTSKDNVTRKTSYLVVGTDPGSKLTRARELGVKELDENEFLQLLEEKGQR